MSLPTTAEPVELQCPNDKCDGIDGEYDNTVPCWSESRVTWDGEPGSCCPICGAVGVDE